MDIMQTILERRSIRTFTDKPVSDEDIQAIIKAGMYAPSAGNQRPWEFIVVKETQKQSELSKALPNGGMLPSASVGIVVCGNTKKERFPGYWVQDCSAAIQNMLLASTALGIGSLWLGVHPMEEWVAKISAQLSLPESVIPLGIVALGYHSNKVSIPDRFDSTAIHNETWKGE